MPLTIEAKHEVCGREVGIIVTRLGSDRTYEGYCSFCGGVVSGFLIEKIDNVQKPITPPV